MKVEEYIGLKSKIDALRQQKSRAEGALEQAEKKLKAELGVSARYADRRIAELENKAEQSRRQVDQKLDAFAEKWGEKLEEVG